MLLSTLGHQQAEKDEPVFLQICFNLKTAFHPRNGFRRDAAFGSNSQRHEIHERKQLILEKAVVHEPHEKHEQIQMHTVVDAVTRWVLR